ncbi:hypothetical protein PVAG01_05555 [Phlyctema vagabunda]|uniref:Uncharacterized protein n=1 Tax=Phlyctema vagabunda TaxID=108571 RepID=A0ABR4PKG1_9HELO
MSAGLSSSNPFRRKGSTSTIAATTIPSPSVPDNISFHDEKLPYAPEHQEALHIPTRTVKKVRVQSPPPSSPEADVPYPPTSVPRHDIISKPDHDPFDGSLSDTSEDEHGNETVPHISNMPANPFQKTLETMEGGAAPAAAVTHVASPGRMSMDVDAFKRLLMTGSSGLGTPTTVGAPTLQVGHHGLGDGGSSTDVSSISRQSIFEPVHETHAETPRTSHEISEPDDDHRGLTPDYSVMASSNRRKPPPPNSRHGKLIKMELRDDPVSPGLQITPPSTGISQQYFNASTSSLLSSERSPTDLNKPLPPAPTRASHESDRESIFDREAAGKTPEPPSPSASIKRKTPPAPPITRRHSQLVSDSKLSRHNSGRLSPRVEEDGASISDSIAERPRSENGKAPPPPPSRRVGSVRVSSASSLNPQPQSPPASALPPVPPARVPSVRQRPPSVSSMEIPVSRRASMVPPPPPPRHGQSIHDTSRRASGDSSRRSIDSNRRASAASSTSQMDRPGTSSSGVDVLADLSALQREIDALRGQSQQQTT